MKPHNYEYDYFVIGGGSGGVRSARIAAGHGAKVGIAENWHWGGTCVNVGCVPKKLLAYASDYGPAYEDAKGFGWNADNISFHWKTLIENKDKEIKRLNSIYQNLLDGSDVTAFNGTASFKDVHTIVVNDREITANIILIATGGTPRNPSYKGAEHAVNSDEVFFINDLPDHIVIEGGGYIAVEFAHIFHGLGAKVSLIYRGEQLLRNFDTEIGTFLTEEMQKQGINIHLKTNISKIEQKDTQYDVFLDNNDVISANLVLSAIGRTPNSKELNLENAGIEHQKNGQIIVNDDYQTNIPHIYAVGDVTDRVNLTPVAISEGHVLADRLFNNQPDRTVTYDNIPTAVFSNPPIGTVGLSEEKAREKGHDLEIYKSTFKPMRHTLSGRDEKTFMKLIVDKKTDIVLGAHMCGGDAPEIIQGIGIAVQCGATKADFDRTMAIHPTAAEEFVTMR